MLRRFFYILIVTGLLTSVGFADEIETSSKVSSVTLYRGSALVTRSVNLPEGAGEWTLIVKDLPAALVPNSLMGADADGVSIRSVRFRQRTETEAPNEQLPPVDEEIRGVQAQLEDLKLRADLLHQQALYLSKIEIFTPAAATAEVKKAVLDPKAVTDISQFVFAERARITESQIKLAQETRVLQLSLKKLQKKRKELAKRKTTVHREAVVFLSKTDAKAKTFALSYVVNNAGWSPQYTFRLLGEEVQMDYAAQVHQTCGEDWNNVTLLLSTATPHMNAEIPLLAPMYVLLRPNVNKGIQPLQMERPPTEQPVDGLAIGLPGNERFAYQQTGNVMLAQRRAQSTAAQNWSRGGDKFALGFDLNRIASQNQYVELNYSDQQLKQWSQDVRGETESLAVTYEVKTPISLGSRREGQLVPITVTTMKANSFYEAAPLLTSAVFRGAEVVNTTDQPLLAGKYTAYVGTEFVGNGQLPLVAKGQDFTLGFGVDSQLRCRRELVDKSDKTFLGSRTQTFEYELAVENFKDAPVHVRLLDRIPATRNKALKIEIQKTSQPLSKNAEYLAREQSKGLLRWDITAPARSGGAKAKTVTYTFEMKLAADKNVGAVFSGEEAKMKADYIKMLKKKR
jgi:hypothetical protein